MTRNKFKIGYNAPNLKVSPHMTFDQFEDAAFYIGLAALIGFMMFIIYDLAKRSNAGKFGMAVLFFALGLGMLGFIIKGVLKLTMGI
ncbi:hypothetical protein NBRC116188_24620 [Oceaniserpentilla sp. 4NH20-0058]